MNALYDKDFLKELDNLKNREIYARITALSNKELPIEVIEGKVTGGSVNIDGTSAVRRTCSISMIADEVNINNFYWGLNNKFKLELGLKNLINSNYPDIIWFPQGIYVITSFNTSLSTRGFNISISGKDKMCLLNGDVGGSIPASVDFGAIDEVVGEGSDAITVRTQLPIKRIIKEMLHAYALESYHNIVINDLEDLGLELLEYRGDSPLYLLYHIAGQKYTQMYFDGETKCYLLNTTEPITLSRIPKYNERIDDLLPDINKGTIIKLPDSDTKYTVSKIEFGQTAGYRLTDLVYAGELISNIGESITSILDKIVKMLGNFEYFYDLDGRFIFQRKKTYLNTSWNPIITTDSDTYIENSVYADSVIYHFDDNNLISSFQNTPNLINLKNDYSIWGNRKSIYGKELPVHYRYAIHHKPKEYKSIKIEESDILSHNNQYPNSKLSPQEPVLYTDTDYDWREIIYQMACDYYKYNQLDIYTSRLIEANPETCASGSTGYEQFYIDIFSYWRDLYNPNSSPKYYEQSYVLNQDKTLVIDQPLSSIFIKENYIPVSNIEDKNSINRDEVLVYKEINGQSELQKLIDTIEVIYKFNNDGNQDQGTLKYYFSAGENGFQAITSDTANKVEKKELYVSEDGEHYTYILDSISLDNGNYFIKEETENYESIENLPEKIKKIYFNDKEKLIFNKYYTITELGMDGWPVERNEEEKIPPVYEYLKYYIRYYDYYSSDKDIEENNQSLYWNKKISTDPDLLDFWFDFLDSTTDLPEGVSGSELDSYSISAIGNRSKVVNDSTVKSIYFRNVPNVIFTTYNDLQGVDLSSKTGYVPMFITSDERKGLVSDYAYFNISAQGKSAKEALDELLYNHTYCTESITISAIPVYYLQPNTRISVKDEQSKINGEYIVSRISYPLTYNGMMNIQATKAPQRLY